MVIPSTIRGLVETRSQLTGMLRAFRLHGPRGLFTFGRHHRAEAVILPWPLFEQLSVAAHTLEDAAHAVELDRRRRNPRGPGKLSLARAAELLGVALPPAARTRKAAVQLTAWPTALDDLVRLGEEQPPATRSAIAETLADVVHGRQAGFPMASQPGQPSLDGYRRLVVPLGEAGAAVMIVVGTPAGAQAVDLLAVLPTGPLIGALQELANFADLDALSKEESDTA
ncbi:hypothetical protein AB0C07_37885 [Actinoplanes missouriensis]|uniref:hypothetical protein n=1 Tax=Actinoplanes missouriensis TaxID=1866 RepID=UPI0033D0014C